MHTTPTHRLDQGYHELTSDDELENPPDMPVDGQDLLLDMPLNDNSLPYFVVPHDQRKTTRWNHIEDLDAFFRRVYTYHQKHGFTCMCIESTMLLLQFIFVVVFVTFLCSCVDYGILFKDKPIGGHNATDVKVKLKDAISPPGECLAGMNGTVMFFLIMSIIFWIMKVALVTIQLLQYLKVKHFYTTALHIMPHELDNMTWHDVQQRLLEVQREHQMCVHKKELTELDVYQRILRYENYLVAMVNKEVIPLKFEFPFVGQVAFLSSGLRYNLELLLFWGHWAPFENSWHLKEEYRKGIITSAMIEQLSKGMLIVGVLNIVLMPLILMWQLLFTFFSYADMVKREPGYLGTRMWSEYSRLHLRHLNELDHELNSRLCMGYKAATHYMNSFTSHVTVVIAQNGIFFFGSLWVVLVGLTIWDEDFLAVEHIVTAIALLSMILAGCRAAIPDEHMVWCPEKLMKTILQHIHYMPDHWSGAAHTSTVRDEFSNLFTYKFNHLLCELFSPLLTPFIILGPLRNRCPAIVAFFVENTQRVEGVGDICSYSQMHLLEHGNPVWTAVADPLDESILPPAAEPPRKKQSEMGKTELSLAHFKLTNPHWQPDNDTDQKFLRGLTNHLEHNLQSVAHGPVLKDSFHSFASLNPMLALSNVNTLRSTCLSPENPLKGGGVTSAQGPLTTTVQSGFEQSVLSMIQSGSTPTWPPMPAPPSLEISSAQMCVSALFMHEKRQFRSQNYGTPSRRTSQYARPSGLGNIVESRAENTPLLQTTSTR